MTISIHALAKRATTHLNHLVNYDNISIHALAKRATSRSNSVSNNCSDFNPRPRKEGDEYSAVIGFALAIFQSTPSQRGRLMIISHFCVLVKFQSTPSQRGRPDADDAELRRYIISIHALAKRATANLYNDYLYFEAKYHISDIFPL